MGKRSEIKTVLSTLTWSKSEIDQLRKAFAPAEFVQCSAKDKDTVSATLPRAQVALLAGKLDDNVLNAAHMAWVHCDAAGLDSSARPEVFARGVLLTGSAGRSGPALAQHAFYFALAFVYDVKNALARQAKHQWDGAEAIRARGALWGKTLGIVGFGYTGKEMAKTWAGFRDARHGLAEGQSRVPGRRRCHVEHNQWGRSQPGPQMRRHHDRGESVRFYPPSD